ncbi:MAG: hypothetical protein PHS64_07995 [Candidatus Omnitrophica bacterium]|nr:hypothetical protein [Candidatus Omnitrophota bacterium]
MKKYELKNCGTVMSLDLTKHKDFGYIVVELVGDQIARIIDVLYEKLPSKTPSDKKCKEFLNTRLSPGKTQVEVNIIPVLNKTSLKTGGEYIIRKPRQAVV